MGGSPAVAPFLFAMGKNAPPVAPSVGVGSPSAAPPPGGVDLGDTTAKAPPLSGWSSLFASADARLQFVAPIVKDGQKVIPISKYIFDQGSSLWDDCLLGQFFGPPPKIAVIHSFAVKLWGRNGRVEVIPLGGEGILFKFFDLITKTWVLEVAPGSLLDDHCCFRNGLLV